MSALFETQCVNITNLNVKLNTVKGVTYPHYIFGPRMVLVEDNGGAVLLPGMNGEVHLNVAENYSLEEIQTPS